MLARRRDQNPLELEALGIFGTSSVWLLSVMPLNLPALEIDSRVDERIDEVGDDMDDQTDECENI